MKKDKRAKLEWGALGQKVPAHLLDLTNIGSYFDQSQINLLNYHVLMAEGKDLTYNSPNEDLAVSIEHYTVDGDKKYESCTKYNDESFVFPADEEMCGNHIHTNITALSNGNHQIIDCQKVKNKYGVWNCCRLYVLPDKAKPNNYKHMHRDPVLLIVQDYDGSIKYFKGKACRLKITEKRCGLVELAKQNTPVGMTSQVEEK